MRVRMKAAMRRWWRSEVRCLYEYSSSRGIKLNSCWLPLGVRAIPAMEIIRPNRGLEEKICISRPSIREYSLTIQIFKSSTLSDGPKSPSPLRSSRTSHPDIQTPPYLPLSSQHYSQVSSA